VTGYDWAPGVQTEENVRLGATVALSAADVADEIDGALKSAARYSSM